MRVACRRGGGPLRLAGRGRRRCSTLTVPHLLVVALLTGVCAGLFVPAEMSAVRTVVPTEQLPTALQPAAGAPARGQPRGRTAGRCAVRRGAVGAVRRRRAHLRLRLGAARPDPHRPLPRPGPGRRVGPAPDIAEGWRFIWERPFFRTLMVWGMCSNLVVNALFIAAMVRLIQGGFAPWSDRSGRDRGRRLRGVRRPGRATDHRAHGRPAGSPWWWRGASSRCWCR